MIESKPMSESQNNRSEEKTQNSPAVFADYARYYDLLYRDKDSELQ